MYSRNDVGGAIYVSEDAPVDFGSAGAGAGSSGAGGGAARLIADGMLQIDGAVIADGLPGGGGQARGGGSGGSIFLSAGSMAGTGVFSAAGGDGAAFSGGGGGGRIRLSSCMPIMLDQTASFDVDGGLQTGGVPSGAPGTLKIGFGTPDASDVDCDGIVDVLDNCPFLPNEDQSDRGGVASPLDQTGALPDGIGDVCQCGDANGDGRVGNADATLLLRCLGGLSPCGRAGIAALPGGASKCGVGDPVGCDVADAVLIQRAVLGLEPLDQACPAANPLAME